MPVPQDRRERSTPTSGWRRASTPRAPGPTRAWLALLLLVPLLLLRPTGAWADAVDPGSTDPQPSGPLRLLLTGDSITQGFHGDFTWRYRLARELTRQGVDVDLVGSKSTPYLIGDWPSSDYADPTFDSDHFATVGTRLADQVPLIGAEVEAQRPDVIVVELGVNDLRHDATPAQTLELFRAWLSAVRGVREHVTVVVSPVLAAQDSTRPGLSAAAAEYDSLLTAALPSLATEDSPVVLARTDQGWDPTTFTVDGLHPNPTGETHIAQRIAEALHSLYYLPQAPQVFASVPWTRTLAPTVLSSPTTTRLTWRSQAVTGARIWWRRDGYAGRASVAAYGRGRYYFHGLVPGARYTFRLQLVRQRLTGPWGPAVTAVVPRPPRPVAVSRVLIGSTGVRWTASTGATSYLVSVHLAGTRSWSAVRSTTGLRWSARRVAGARVWAVNAGGRSAARQAGR